MAVVNLEGTFGLEGALDGSGLRIFDEGNVVDSELACSGFIDLDVENKESLGVLEGHLDIITGNTVGRGGLGVGRGIEEVNLLGIGIPLGHGEVLRGDGGVERGSRDVSLLSLREGIGEVIHLGTADRPVNRIGHSCVLGGHMLPFRGGDVLESLIVEEDAILQDAVFGILGSGSVDDIVLAVERGAVEFTGLGRGGSNGFEADFGGGLIHDDLGLVAGDERKSCGAKNHN